MKFNYAHFPAGTQCEVFVDHVHTVPVAVEVTGVSRNGPRSWLIHVAGKVEGSVIDAFNIDHVTRIIKRGTGPLTINEHPGFLDSEYGSAQWVFHKPKKSYLSFNLHFLMLRALQRVVTPDVRVDGAVLKELLFKRGVVKNVGAGSVKTLREEDLVFKPYLANKKKFKRAVKQLICKALVTHKEEQRREDEWERKEWEREMEREGDHYDELAQKVSCYEDDYYP